MIIISGTFVRLLLSAVQSGEWLKLIDEAGPLACPQSLQTQQGVGHCVGISPLGSAVVGSADGADVFVQCRAQSMTWGQPPAFVPQGGSFTYRYPYLGIDNATKVPIFGSPITIPPWDPLLPLLAPSGVWQGENHTVQAAAFTSDYMHLLQLAANGSAWKRLHSWKFKSPAGWDHIRSPAVMPHTNGSGWRIFVVQSGGNSSRAKGEFLGVDHARWRSNGYQPYAGDGIYRGTLGLRMVRSFEMSTTGEVSNWRNVSPLGWNGGLLGLKLAWSRPLGALLAVSHTGLVFMIDVEPGNFSRPQPLSDVDSGALFKARVISSSPLAYGTDGLILGGENTLHYTRVISSHTGNDTDEPRYKPMASLQYMGPVLQRSAVLLTGQTPTVSVADWDGDGVVDIIAGSSEGRIFLAAGAKQKKKQTSYGGSEENSSNVTETRAQTNTNKDLGLRFHVPTPLRTGDPISGGVEVLVQGGYRVDIQGPSESRWGYTAPVACDWNGDGLMDLVSSGTNSTHTYIRIDTHAHTQWELTETLTFSLSLTHIHILGLHTYIHTCT